MNESGNAVRQQVAAEQLNLMGCTHAPEHPPRAETLARRYVTRSEPPGIYYILGTDNAAAREARRARDGNREREDMIQLLFMSHPQVRDREAAKIKALQIAAKMDWDVANVAALDGSTELNPMFSAMLVPQP